MQPLSMEDGGREGDERGATYYCIVSKSNVSVSLHFNKRSSVDSVKAVVLLTQR